MASNKDKMAGVFMIAEFPVFLLFLAIDLQYFAPKLACPSFRGGCADHKISVCAGVEGTVYEQRVYAECSLVKR